MKVQNAKNVYKPHEFAELLGVSVKTLQRWDDSGKLKAQRTPSDRRYYTHDQYLSYIGSVPPDLSRETVVYARVSTRNQKDDLNNQKAFLQEFCNARGMIVSRIVEDYGSGMNYNRKQWNALIDDVISGSVGTIVVAHKDRFVRFGFDWFERLCERYGTKIIVVNNERMSPQQELVEDIVSILHIFSCRLYGLRKYEREIQKDETIKNEL